MIPTAALSLLPAALILGSSAAEAAARKHRIPLPKWTPDALIAVALIAWLPLAPHLSNSGLALGLGGWLLTATLFTFRGFQAETAVRLRALPLAALLLLAAGLAPEISTHRLPSVAFLIAALDASYVASISAALHCFVITQLNQDGFGSKLESLPELWLIKKTHRIASGLAFAVLTGLAAATAFLAPAEVWPLAVPWFIAAVLQTGLIPLAKRLRYYAAATLFLATAALITVSLSKG